MKYIIKTVSGLFPVETGATSTEYAIMIGLVILVCFATIGTVGGETLDTWSSNSAKIAQSMNN